MTGITKKKSLSRFVKSTRVVPRKSERRFKRIPRGGPLRAADAAPAVILLTEASVTLEAGDLRERARRLDLAVSSLATYAPVVVIGDAEHQTELSALVAAGAADYAVRTGGCLTVALGLVERRLRKALRDAEALPAAGELLGTGRTDVFTDLDREDFGEVLRHELNNPLTGILGKRGASSLGSQAEK
jgi:signal transduction histidine kinase